MSLYETLGLNTDATQEEIKRAYLKMANKYHPDKDTGDSDKFTEILHAYDVLYNRESRAYYDENGTAKPVTDEIAAVYQQLSILLLEVIDHVENGDYMAEMKNCIFIKINRYMNIIEAGKKVIAKREKAIKRIVRKDGGANVLVQIIERDIALNNDAIAKAEGQIFFHQSMMRELDNYLVATNELELH